MTGDVVLASLAVALSAIGTYLLLPHRHGRARAARVQGVGAVLAIIGVILLAAFWTPPAAVPRRLFFYAFAAATICGGVLTITSRNPVHSALWFASVVLSTSGLFLLAGAQFLAAGTVIVYAGAIIVTFLFVIMLAQSEGHALYDRAARAPVWSTLTAYLTLWCLLYALLSVQRPASMPSARAATSGTLATAELAARAEEGHGSAVKTVLDRAIRPTAVVQPGAAHVAALGGSLFTDHLIAVEVVGAILFAALVGAAAIATPKAPVRPNR